MGWKVVEVNTDEHLKLYLNNLCIVRKHERIIITINDIDTLILHNPNTSLTIRLINALTRKNVNIIIFNEKHIPMSHIMPVQGHHKSLKILEQQIAWTHQYKSQTWQNIVKNKIQNQQQLIGKLALKEDDVFAEQLQATKPYDVSNREGHVAKLYWHYLFGLDFRRDRKCLANYLINSVLNYGYTILRSLVIRSIIKKGLDPRLSFWHKSFSNFFALASDLMEPFRPLVDAVAYKYKEQNAFTFTIKEDLIQIINQQIYWMGQKNYVNRVIDMMMDNIVKQESWQFVKLWD